MKKTHIPKHIAYIRVSTENQSCDRQIDGLRDMCDELHVEKGSAVRKRRPVYSKVMRRLSPGDTFVILDLDRAYRSTKDALSELEKLRARNVTIKIANLNLDTSTPYGMLIYTFISALAEFERNLLSQRTKEGIEAARKRGKRIGRPPLLSRRKLKQAAKRVLQTGESLNKVGASYGVAGWTLSRALKREGIAWQT